MPGLLRGVARTAVIAGTATAVSNRVSRRQAERWAQQDYEQQQAYAQQPAYAPAPQPAASGTDDKLAQLKQLGELKQSGVLTEAEFEAQKAKILASS
jgi:Short C-terminal domain